jgi:hypothetical protein
MLDVVKASKAGFWRRYYASSQAALAGEVRHNLTRRILCAARIYCMYQIILQVNYLALPFRVHEIRSRAQCCEGM